MTVQPTPRFARRCGQLNAPIDVHEHFVVQQFSNAGSSWDKENDDSDSAVRYLFTFDGKVGELCWSLFPVAHVMDPQGLRG